MLTNQSAGADLTTALSPTTTMRKVVIVNGSSPTLDLLETAIEAGPYDIVFVESKEHAYSQIRRVQPDLVILCMRPETLDGLDVLSMLKLDERTSAIPVLTYAPRIEESSADEEVAERSDTEIFATKPAIRMN
jgi:PleD family two-component response regulator